MKTEATEIGINGTAAANGTRGTKTQDAGRQGIALVVVLGFLAVLTLMAVGMAISMRTERLASRSYLDMVKARMYCEAALADAMVCVEDVLYSKDTPAVYRISPNFQYYFQDTPVSGYRTFWNLPSIETFPGDPQATLFKKSIIEGTGTNFLPYLQDNFIMELKEDAKTYESLQWIHRTRTTSTGSVVTNGRYMYVILDTSSGMDANYLGREEVYEINPGWGHAFGNYNDYKNSFLPERNNEDIRYETNRDLENRAGRSEGLTTLTWFPPMRRVEIEEQDGAIVFDDFEDGWPLVLAKDESGLKDQAGDIKRYLGEALKDSPWRDTPESSSIDDIFQTLVDFTDSDFRPQKLKAPSIEPVPMINEFVVRKGEDDTGDSIVVEVWAPFVGPSRYTGTFDIEGTVDSIPFRKTGIPAPIGSDTIPPVPERIDIDIDLGDAASDGTYNIKMTVKEEDGGDLDEVELANVQPEEYWECNDPRFNHLDSQWKRYNEGSLGEINIRTAEYQDKGDGTVDGDYLMYCANKPLRSTGDLGYLPVAPWRTIKLYEDPRDNAPDLDPVLDYFTFQKRDEVKYGLINPNNGIASTMPAGLDTLKATPNGGLGKYVGDPSNYEYHNANVKWRVLPYRENWRNNKGVSLNIADTGDFLYRKYYINFVPKFKNTQKTEVAGGGMGVKHSELNIERPMRRASKLFHVRHNLFTVCLWSQTLGEKINGQFQVKAEAQAVALVWRDPYPVSNDNQHHRKFVRFMRWME